MMCSLSNVFAQSWTSGQQVGNGTYYLYNMAAQKYLNRGTKWTTHAAVDGAGMPVTISSINGGYSIQNNFDSKYMCFYNNSIWMDQSQFAFTFEDVSSDFNITATIDNI